MFELALTVPQALVEPVSDALMDTLDALAVSVEDADAASEAEQALYGEPGLPPPQPGWSRSTLKALFTEEAQATEALTWLLAQDWRSDACDTAAAELGMSAAGLQAVPDQDWVRLTQAQFAPVDVAPGFWIVPSWHQTPEGATRVIRLDPGMAFGTGTHPTTRMCLRWIARHATAWASVLDYGCGSGILALGAGRHGARRLTAVDIDPAAVEATRTNAAANGVPVQAGPPELAQGTYELVLANILATPLKLLAPLLCGHLADDGHLLLSGILERQAADLRAAYAPWCAIDILDTEDGWVLMGGGRGRRA